MFFYAAYTSFTGGKLGLFETQRSLRSAILIQKCKCSANFLETKIQNVCF